MAASQTPPPMLTPAAPVLSYRPATPGLTFSQPALDSDTPLRFIHTALAAFPDLRVASARMEGGRMVARVEMRATGQISEWAFPLRAL